MHSEEKPSELERIYPSLTEPYAFAAMLWPPVIGVFMLAGDEFAVWRYALYAWLAIWHLAAYRRTAGHGNVTLFNSAVLALVCYGHPSAWAVAGLPVLLIGLLAAQRSNLNTAARAPVSSPTQG